MLGVRVILEKGPSVDSKDTFYAPMNKVMMIILAPLSNMQASKINIQDHTPHTQ